MKRESAALLISALLCLQTASAVYLTSEGKAPIRHNDISTARYLATLDAMNQASLENGAQVTSDTIMNNLAVRSDTIRIRTQGKVGKVHMLHEYEEDGIYHVRISAEVSDNALNCGSPTALVHNKRVGVTLFINDTPQDTQDLRDVEHGLARMMLHQINRSSALRAVDLTEYAIVADNLGEDQIQAQHLARQSGAQYILAGRLTQAHREEFGDLAESGLMKGLSTLLQKGAEDRHVQIETVLYDGDSGDIIARAQEGMSVFGDTYVGRDHTVGTHAFRKTRTGTAFQQLIERHVHQLRDHLSCEPMTTTILSIQDNVITLPVGSNAGIHPGDRLIIVEQNNPLKILGTLQITQVSTTRASGMTDVDASTLGISITDLVRSW